MKESREITAVRKGEALNFTLAETAQLANVSERLLGLEAQRGRLRVVRIGRRVLVPRAEVMRLVGLADTRDLMD